MAGIITREDIKIVAKNILDFLEREKIKYYGDLEGKVGDVFFIEKNIGHSITLEEHPSELETLEYSISYIINGKGIPIEARLNNSINYTRLIIKGNFKLGGYSVMIRDTFGNLIQGKIFRGCSVHRLKQELEVLAVK